jgi:predicted RNA-binding Zn ribbon-like protein
MSHLLPSLRALREVTEVQLRAAIAVNGPALADATERRAVLLDEIAGIPEPYLDDPRELMDEARELADLEERLTAVASLITGALANALKPRVQTYGRRGRIG